MSPEYQPRSLTEQGKDCRQQDAEKERCLNRCVEGHIVKVHARRQGDEYATENPGKVRDDTSKKHPLQVDTAQHRAVAKTLDTDMNEGIWHVVRLPDAGKEFQD